MNKIFELAIILPAFTVSFTIPFTPQNQVNQLLPVTSILEKPIIDSYNLLQFTTALREGDEREDLVLDNKLDSENHQNAQRVGDLILPYPNGFTQELITAEIPNPEELATFRQLMDQASTSNWHELPMGELMQVIAEQFVGATYQAGLLDKSDQESLVISLKQFDCVLFVETVLAIARGVAVQDYSYPTLVNHVQDQRYLHGELDGYCSRLHYFSSWIDDNQKRGNVKNIATDLGGVSLNKKLSFMSTHRQSYRQLINNNTNYQCIVEMEANLEELTVDYIPTSKIRSVYSFLQPGDIVGIATNISGLDVTHTGLVYHHRDGNLGLIHASPIGQVTIARDLQSYVSNVKNATGILVARPTNPG
ncbi:MAG: N-acetylmuramoyl-L-alanine amidase-like domain-containing protein [Coleofasciculaceae cyanobacterium]